MIAAIPVIQNSPPKESRPAPLIPRLVAKSAHRAHMQAGIGAILSLTSLYHQLPGLLPINALASADPHGSVVAVPH